MRKMFLILSLVAITLTMSANDVFAQRGYRGGRASIGVGRGYYGSYYGGRGYYSPYYGSRGYYSPYYGSRGYYPYTYSQYSPGYYSSAPSYYYSDPIVPAVPATEYRQSFYSDPNAATLTVFLPDGDAQVWFDDTPTAQRGVERIFHTPGLQQAGTYTIKARWTDNGRTVDRQRQVQVQPGQAVVVDFRGK